jgi:hypothetical protein
MSRKPTPKFQVPTRASTAAQDAAFSALEKRAEERGNGAASRSGEASAKGRAASGSKLRRETRGERVAGYLPAELEHELRMFCARERRSVSDALTEAVTLLLAHAKSNER